jgi:hypothetical protein
MGVLFEEEHTVRVFDSWVQGRIFGLKRRETIENWRKVHNDGL